MRTLMMIASFAMVGTGIFCVANASAAFLSVAFVIGIVFVLLGAIELLISRRADFDMSEKGVSIAKDGILMLIFGLVILTGQVTDDISAQVMFALWLTIEGVLASSEIGMKGVQEVKTIFDYLKSCNLKNRFELDLTLARGLNYYTGAIFEVKALDVQIGSITGGGRYDNLTGIFGLPGLSGVGISFGADRIFDVLNALDLYPQKTTDTTKLLFVNFGDKETAYCMPLASQCRKEGISCEIFPDKAKIKKQMAYANAKRIAFVAMAGENEINDNKVTLKNMETGEQMLVDSDKIANVINA